MVPEESGARDARVIIDAGDVGDGVSAAADAMDATGIDEEMKAHVTDGRDDAARPAEGACAVNAVWLLDVDVTWQLRLVLARVAVFVETPMVGTFLAYRPTARDP